MNPTHKLPQHLGAWPCRLLGQSTFFVAAIDPANEGHEIHLQLVEYDTTQPTTGFGTNGVHRIYIPADQLVRITPAEPDAPYAIGADGNLYRRLPGTEPGTGEKLWLIHNGGKATTWLALTTDWAERESSYQIEPLVPDPLTNAPELPWSYAGIVVELTIGVSDSLPIRLESDGTWVWLDADDAETAGLALLSASRQARERKPS